MVGGLLNAIQLTNSLKTEWRVTEYHSVNEPFGLDMFLPFSFQTRPVTKCLLYYPLRHEQLKYRGTTFLYGAWPMLKPVKLVYLAELGPITKTFSPQHKMECYNTH